MQMTLVRCGMWLAAVLAVAMLSAPAARAANEIVIGEFGSLTGNTATFGTSTHDGIMLALDQINAAGGVLGRPVKVIVEDDQSKPEEAVTVVQKLINQDRVVALIGEVASSRSLAAAPFAQRAHVPMLSPASTNPKVTEKGNYIFRSCFTDEFQAGAMATFAVDTLKARRIAILYDVKNDYSVGLRDYFTRDVQDQHAQIVADESYSEGDSDFNAQLTKIKATHPDAIYVPGYYTEVGQICRQARALGVTVPLLGGDGWDSDKTFAIGGNAVNGCYFTNHYSPNEQRPAVQAFVTAFQARYGRTPDAMAILGYDAMRLMADAISRAGSTDSRAIRDALAATRDFPGASGSITIDSHRNAKKPIFILKIQDGKAQFVQSLNP